MAWIPEPGSGGVSDHGDLDGLADDDHTQYLNTVRHAAIDAADHGSGAATAGQVLTADGAGGAAWKDPTGGRAFAETIGDNSNTSFQVQHDLGTQDLVVQLWDLTGAEPIEATGDASQIKVDDDNNITVTFSAAPATGSYRVVILASGGSTGGGGGLASGWQSGNVIAAAVGIPIVTSSNKQPGRVGFVIDGAITEEQYWSGSSQQIGDYIEFDFGVAIELEGLRMVGLYGSNIGTDYPRGWEVLSSDTGAFSGEEIQRGTGSATGWGGGTLDTTFTAASARYWRIRLTSAAGNHWRINEVFFRIP